MTDLQLGVVGCAGRMGINLLRQIAATEGCAIVGGSERPGHDDLGRDLGELAGLGELGLAVEADPKPMFERAAVVLDFTVPAASVAHAALAVETKTNLVIGTTGMTADDDAAVNKAAETIAIMREGNMSLGVNVLALVAKQVASLLDDEAVLAELDSGKIAGVTFDAFRVEPPDDWHLVKHARVTATPHIGGFTEESVAKAMTVAVENLLSLLELA